MKIYLNELLEVIDANLQNNSQDVEAVTHVHKQRRRRPFFLYTFFCFSSSVCLAEPLRCTVYVYVCSYVPLPSADAAVNPIQMNLLCFFCFGSTLA